MGNAPSVPSREIIASRYQMERTLGRGGMGAVYRVLDTGNQRALALKCLTVPKQHADFDNAKSLLELEYRTLAQLAHPRVVQVFEYGIAEQGPYYTMELLDGDDLQQRAPLDWPEVCALLRDVCSSLSLLHSRRLVHRDVSPRNVRCTPDGRAKLIDFGAIMPMGVPQQLVGTPPCTPPEALYQQSLDGRADLYSVGAVLYWALTGRHAYPARAIEYLPELWRTNVRPPSHFVAEIPKALDELVMALLRLEPSARPRSAAEVIDRLGVIANLESDDAPSLPRAYLSTPSLAGRDSALAQVRSDLFRALAGTGGAIMVEGPAGVGRSRFLDACVLEARLAGATVARASATDAGAGAYGVVRALLRGLSSALPREMQSISKAVPWIASMLHEHGRIEDSAELRRHQRSLRQCLWALSEQRLLALAVDDVDRADEASQAALAAVADAIPSHRMLLAMSATSNAAERARASTFAVLRQRTKQLELANLAQTETEQVVRSVFGDIPNVQLLATRIFELSEGNPGVVMQLTQHAVDKGIARYELGSWILPNRLEEGLFPQSAMDAVTAKLAELGSDARELAEALAIASRHHLNRQDYAKLTEHADAEHTQSALDELVARGVLDSNGERYGFRNRIWCDAAVAGLSPEQSSALHRRLANLLAELGRDAIDVARHFQAAGDDDRTIDVLLGELARGTRSFSGPADYADILERAAEGAGRLQRPELERFHLMRELVRVGQNMGVRHQARYLRKLTADLRIASGLAQWEELGDTLPAGERLSRALEAAQRRYSELPVTERRLAPRDAIKELAAVVREAVSFGSISLDCELQEAMPSLEAFVPLSPAIEVFCRCTIPASRGLVAGRFEEGLELFQRAMDRLQQPDRLGLDELSHRWVYLGAHFALGHLEAVLGVKNALEHVAELEQHPRWQIAAWDVRRAHAMRQGDLVEAERCRNRIELLQIEDPVRPPMVGTSARIEFDIYTECDDLTGLKESFGRLDEMAALHQSFAAYRPLFRAQHERMRGDFEQSLQEIEQALALLSPGQHQAWPHAARCQLECLLALGRFAEARQLGAKYLEAARQAGLQIMASHIAMPLALAEAALGETAAAVARMDSELRAREAYGHTGLTMGLLYEYRARLAVILQDPAAFSDYAARCAAQFQGGAHNPALMAKLERLNELANRWSLTPSNAQSDAVELGGASAAAHNSQTETVRLMLTQHETFEARAKQSIQMILDQTGASEAYLFLARAGEIRFAASSSGASPPDLMQDAAAQFVQSELEKEVVTVAGDAPCKGPTVIITKNSSFRPLLLACVDSGDLLVAGVALVRVEPPRAAPQQFFGALARYLIDLGDASPLQAQA